MFENQIELEVITVWKKLFVILLSINLLLFVLVALWFQTLPRSHATTAHQHLLAQAANVDLTIGQQAVNTYLTYALDEQKDVRNVLDYASVRFTNDWNIILGVKIAGRIIPCDVELMPSVHQGDLWLPVTSASIGGVSVPKSLLFYLFKHAPWPSWIVVDDHNQRIDVNLADRAPSKKSPYHIRAKDYSPQSQTITFIVSILPKQIAKTN